MRYVATVGDRTFTIELQENGHAPRVLLDGRELTVDFQLVGGERSHLTSTGDRAADHFSVLVGDRSYEAYARRVDDVDADDDDSETVEIMVRGHTYTVGVRDERSQALATLAGGKHHAGDAPVRAPMPGLVANVLAQAGDEVERGQTVVILEAMKMENDLTAPRSGVVKSVRTGKGQTVNQGDVLVVVGDPEGERPEDDDDDA